MLDDAKNAIWHFVNEEARIATELLEGHIVSDLEISAKGVFNKYPDQMIEFIWKGKQTIVFKPEVTANGIELVAHHLYDNNARVTFSEGNEV